MSDKPKCNYKNCDNRHDFKYNTGYMTGYRNRTHNASFCSQECLDKFNKGLCHTCGAHDKIRYLEGIAYCTSYPFEIPCYFLKILTDTKCQFCDNVCKERKDASDGWYYVHSEYNKDDIEKYFICKTCYKVIKDNKCQLCQKDEPGQLNDDCDANMIERRLMSKMQTILNPYGVSIRTCQKCYDNYKQIEELVLDE
jgi:hypothetical protein